MSFGQPRRNRPYQGQKKQKNYLQKNKKFTAILLLLITIAFVSVHLFMWQLHDKTCEVSCGDPTVGCWNPIGYAAVFGPCHGFNAKTNQTQVGFLNG